MWYLSSRPAKPARSSYVSQPLQPLFNDLLLFLIHSQGIIAHQFLQRRGQQFLKSAEAASKSLFRRAAKFFAQNHGPLTIHQKLTSSLLRLCMIFAHAICMNLRSSLSSPSITSVPRKDTYAQTMPETATFHGECTSAAMCINARRIAPEISVGNASLRYPAWYGNNFKLRRTAASDHIFVVATVIAEAIAAPVIPHRGTRKRLSPISITAFAA